MGQGFYRVKESNDKNWVKQIPSYVPLGFPVEYS